MKKIICFLLTAVLVFSVAGCMTKPKEETPSDTDVSDTNIPDEAVTESPDADFLCFENKDGTLAVSYIGKDTCVVVPSEIDGKTVTKIHHEGFSPTIDPGFKLCSVTLPDTITEIEYKAFMNCTYLSEINLPSSITHIGSEAFLYCTALKHITISSDCLDDYSFNTFASSGLETVELKEGITMLPRGMFVVI